MDLSRASRTKGSFIVMQRWNASLKVQLVSSGLQDNTRRIVVIPNYMDVYDFTPVQYPADDVTAEWQTTHFNFHDIDENVLKLDVLGHDDPTMIRKFRDLSGIDLMKFPWMMKALWLFSGTEVLG